MAVLGQGYREKRGIALEKGCYGYETVDGFSETDSCDGIDTETRIQSAVNDIDVIQTNTTDSNEILDSVKDELEHLGYL